MPKIAYEERKFRAGSLALIRKMDDIVTDYQRKGYQLTLRQCYYQLVARDIIENTEKSYKRIADLLDNGRKAGLIDWQAIEDRTRQVRGWSGYESPAAFLKSVSRGFMLDLWREQPCYVEVWVEKDALVDVVRKACAGTRTPFFSCRGFSSQSAMWRAAERFKAKQDKKCIILHLGDHDPSGLDMTRDIQERLIYFGAGVQVQRIALNMEQVDTYNPPPNPAKETDSRYKGYQLKYGVKSWELDALRPEVIESMIDEHIKQNMDMTLFNETLQQEQEQEQELYQIAYNYQGALMGAAGE
jgi:hypothetical protein